MIVFLVMVAIAGGIVGGFLLSQATLGVGMIAGACLLAIIARIYQAAKQHEDQMLTLSSISGQLHQ